MLQITNHERHPDGTIRPTTHDIEDLRLPSGEFAHKLPLDELNQRLMAMGIDVQVGTARNTSLLAYSRHMRGTVAVGPNTAATDRPVLADIDRRLRAVEDQLRLQVGGGKQ